MNPTTGTFISMDTYQGTIFDPTSLHKYLYANANPVMNVDPSGYNSVSLNDLQTAMVATTILAAASMVYSSFALNYYRNFRNSFSTDLFSVRSFDLSLYDIVIGIHLGLISATTEIIRNELIASAVVLTEFTFTSIRDHVIERLRQKGNRYGNQYELHHIVAQKSLRAIPARAILFLVDIGVNDECNTVLLKKAVHKFLHTSLYFSYVNYTVCSAYTFAVQNDLDNRTQVLISLAQLKVSLLGLNWLV